MPDPFEGIAAKALEAAIKRVGWPGTTPWLRNIFYSLNFQAQYPEAVTGWLTQFLTNDPVCIVAALKAWVQRKDPSNSLSGVKCPSLVIFGTEDVFAGLAKAQLVQQAIPGAQLLPIGNSGHLTLQEQAASVTLALTQIVQLGSSSVE